MLRDVRIEAGSAVIAWTDGHQVAVPLLWLRDHCPCPKCLHPETRQRLARWVGHFAAQGSDAFTAERQAMAMLYRETVHQAQLLAYADDFWLLAVMFAVVPIFLPLMRRIRLEPPDSAPTPERAPAHALPPE